jgi:WD40 repeat protein
MDTVTSLTVVNNNLISGSKDKNLRLWSLQNSTTNSHIRCTTHTFNDYINTVESDRNLQIFYAGSRDGQVKVATINND